MIDHLAILGVGSIGASLGMALRDVGYVKYVTGIGRDLSNLQLAKQRGAIDTFSTDIASARDADVVVLAMPVGSMRSVMHALQPHLQSTTVVTDVGSVKASVIDAWQSVFKTTSQFVPGHPVAGTEKSGAAAARRDLYHGCRVILTPTQTTDKRALADISSLWQVVGAKVETMTAEHHDNVLAMTSHLPHMLAFALVGSLARMPDADEIFRYAAGGFKDFTRIASSDPVMWRDICMGNRDALLTAMERYIESIRTLYAAVDRADADQLMDIFGHAKASRDHYVPLV